MSGKIAANSGFVTRADFTRLQSKVDAVVSRIAELSREIKTVQQPTTPSSTHTDRKPVGGVKSWLYSKAGSRTPRGQTSASDDKVTCQNCGKAESPITRRYLPASDPGKHIYPIQANEEGPDEQRRLRNELNQFQTEVKNDIRLLQKSVKDIHEFCKSLEKLVNDSISDLQRTIDGMKEQIVMNTECPDQQGFQSKTGNVDVTRYDQSKLANDGLADDGGRYSRQVLRKHTTVL